jgi:hypothetical protein
MKRTLFASVVLILSLSCSHSRDYHVNQSTPGEAIKTYYEAFRTSDFRHQKETVVSWIEDWAEERFKLVCPILQSYEIINMREAKDRKDDTFHLPEDAVDILVKENYKNGEQRLYSFILRKFDSKWLIESWDIVGEDDAADDPVLTDESYGIVRFGSKLEEVEKN